ncbi:Detected protein of unknown function [Hibiscus syriacus]|uniref:Glycoside hydrolase family 31 N-terminal domain-containing protein n=1 Tax=Hibiscus syriacus TaxID=106335 RepID=A0A6A3CFB8_HIBSY|nr:Detected protein of unknown function [Hibiscus syriacus]
MGCNTSQNQRACLSFTFDFIPFHAVSSLSFPVTFFCSKFSLFDCLLLSIIFILASGFNFLLRNYWFVENEKWDVLIVSNKAPLYILSFECCLGQQIVKLELPAGTSVYGTGEVSGQLERTGKRVFTWNTDARGYGPETTSLYQSHPWVLAVLPNGEALGILADTTRRCEV